jgi:hypothetical protein
MRSAIQRAEILVDHHGGSAFAANDAKRFPDILCHQRRETFGRLVDQDQIGIGHRAPDGEHLLLAAGQLMTTVPAARMKARKQS